MSFFQELQDYYVNMENLEIDYHKQLGSGHFGVVSILSSYWVHNQKLSEKQIESLLVVIGGDYVRLSEISPDTEDQVDSGLRYHGNTETERRCLVF